MDEYKAHAITESVGCICMTIIMLSMIGGCSYVMTHLSR